jgi:Family of unknown function (DUF5996)
MFGAIVRRERGAATMSDAMPKRWPDLAYPAWRDTAATLQLWTQIVGKVRIALTPWQNHGWHVPLYVTARGLGTSPMPIDDELLEIEFDFLDHRLRCWTSAGPEATVPLKPQSVATFYEALRSTLEGLGVRVAINTMPNEVPDPIPFPDDHSHAAYDAAAAHAFWRVLISADRVFKLFRTGFLGKASPVHFFWGSFDLAVTRFSGRRAPPHPGGVPALPDAVTREAYSHEVSSAGFWPGNDAFPEAAFYAYAYPEPAGFRTAAVTRPGFFEDKLGEYVLPYAAAVESGDPDGTVLRFLQETYAAAADAAGWDRTALETPMGVRRRPRLVLGSS